VGSSFPELAYHDWNVDPHRAGQCAGSVTVTDVLRQQEFQGGTSGRPRGIRFGFNAHSVGHRSGAGGQQLSRCGFFDNTEHAGGEMLQPVQTAQRRNGDAQLLRRLQQRCSPIDLCFCSVNP